MQMNLIELIDAAKIKEAFKAMKEAISEHNLDEFSTKLSLFSSQYNDLEEEAELGLITRSEQKSEKARIKFGLIKLAQKIEEKIPSTQEERNTAEEISSLINEEKAHLIDRFKVLREKRNFLQEQADIASDPSQIFTLEKQLKELKTKIDKIKSELAEIETQEASKPGGDINPRASDDISKPGGDINPI